MTGMEMQEQDAIDCLNQLMELARRSALVHISFDPEDQEYLVVALQNSGKRGPTAFSTDFTEAVAKAAGCEKVYKCRLCGEEKVASLFTPNYVGEQRTADGGRDYACLDCNRGRMKRYSRKYRDEHEVKYGYRKKE